MSDIIAWRTTTRIKKTNKTRKNCEREKTEKLEQLRIQDLNKIGVSIIKENILGVDTKEDLIKVNNILKKWQIKSHFKEKTVPTVI